MGTRRHYEDLKLKHDLISEGLEARNFHWEQAEVVTVAFCSGKTKNLLFYEKDAWRTSCGLGIVD